MVADPQNACDACAVLAQAAPLVSREQQIIRSQPGATEWEAAAAQRATLPSPLMWDLLISHAGNSSDKLFACALKQLIERLGWAARVFLHVASSSPGLDSHSHMLHSLGPAHVIVLLCSKDFLRRSATQGGLELLLKRHARLEAVLLPVFLSVTVEESERELSGLLKQGMSVACHDLTHRMGRNTATWPLTSSSLSVALKAKVCMQRGPGDSKSSVMFAGCSWLHWSCPNMRLPMGIPHWGQVSWAPMARRRSVRRCGTQCTRCPSFWAKTSPPASPAMPPVASMGH